MHLKTFFNGSDVQQFLYETKAEFIYISSREASHEMVMQLDLMKRFHYAVIERHGFNMYSYLAKFDSPYKHKFNDFFRRLTESGLTAAFKSWSRFVKSTIFFKKFNFDRAVNESEYLVTFEGIKPLLFVFLYLMIIATTAFVGEFIVVKVKT